MPALTVAAGKTGSNGSSPPGDAKKGAPVPVLPFTRAAMQRTSQGQTVTTTSFPATLQDIAVPVGGWGRYLDILVTITSTGNSATVALAADAPWSWLQLIAVNNSSGDPILAPISGYQLYLINKYGNHIFASPQCDPRRDQNFVALTTGSGATAGSGSFRLRIPFEVTARDALGALPNSAANMQYIVKVNLPALSAVYSTAPNGTVTARIDTVGYWWNAPLPMSPVGVPQATAPLAAGATALWRVQQIPVTSGDVSLRISAVGAIISNMICTLRTAANARTSADLPALLQLKINGIQQIVKPSAQYLGDTAMLYSYNTGALDAAAGLDTGVFLPWPEMNAMRGEVAPDAPRDQWVPTEAGTLLEIQGTTWGASAAKLEVLTREVRPGEGGAAPIYAPVIN